MQNNNKKVKKDRKRVLNDVTGIQHKLICLEYTT
jgi:hypothetical protein